MARRYFGNGSGYPGANPEWGYLVLVKPDGTLDFRVTRGPHLSSSDQAQDQISTTILHQVITSGEPLIVRDATADPKWAQSKSVSELKLRSVMCVPLLAQGEVIGAIYVENRRVSGRFKEGNQIPLAIFANQAAIAIENAALNEELEERVADRTRELEQAKAHVEQSWAEAVELNRLRTMLLGNVAHDLRSPLSIIIEALQLMQDGAFGAITDDQKVWIKKSLDAGHYVLNLTNDVFDLSKIEMGGLVLYPENVCLSEFLQQNYNTALGLPWPESVRLDITAPPDLPCIEIDPVRISQVLLNLFTNALKFTSVGSVTLYATNDPESGEVVIGVGDTGGGIDPEQLDRLFQRFQQIDRDEARRRVGTGLGLAICRELVELHGGRIWVENHPGKGADFKFVLPVSPEKVGDPQQERQDTAD